MCLLWIVVWNLTKLVKNQKEFIKKNKQDLVLGNLFSSASQSFEKAVISQTWD